MITEYGQSHERTKKQAVCEGVSRVTGKVVDTVKEKIHCLRTPKVGQAELSVIQSVTMYLQQEGVDVKDYRHLLELSKAPYGDFRVNENMELIIITLIKGNIEADKYMKLLEVLVHMLKTNTPLDDNY